MSLGLPSHQLTEGTSLTTTSVNLGQDVRERKKEEQLGAGEGPWADWAD